MIKQTNQFVKNNDGTVDIILDRKNGIKLSTKISLCDFNSIICYGKWSVSFYKKSNSYYVSNSPRRYSKTLLHRFIMSCPSNMEVDHIDGNTLNNTRQNLRLVARNQNSQNRNILNPKNKSCGIKNINFNTKLNRWVIRFCVLGKTTTKYALTLEDAKIIADKLRPIIHPFYARD